MKMKMYFLVEKLIKMGLQRESDKMVKHNST
jgi:hypothetical protein